MEQRPPVFWEMTGFTPEAFEELVDQIQDDMIRPRNVRGKFTPEENAQRRPRACGLSPRNRVLLVMVWIRQYLTVMSLAELFGVDKMTVSDDIHHIVPILRKHLHDQIKWPSEEEMETMMGSWPEFPNAFGAVDATIHPVWKPLVGQAFFYRGDKHCHFMLAQVTVDVTGRIIDTSCGYRGGTNDSAAFGMSRLGQGQLPLPPQARLLADGGYPARAPLLVPYDKVAANDPLRLAANYYQRRYRAVVERTIAKVKVFRSASEKWRHPKAFEPMLFFTVCCLMNLKMDQEIEAWNIFISQI